MSKTQKWILPITSVVIAIVATWLFLVQNNQAVPPDFDWIQGKKDNDWSTSLPNEAGFQLQPLYDLHQYVNGKNPKKRIQSILIVQNGNLVFEQYYAVPAVNDGTPMPQHFPPAYDTPHQMRSITKTVTSTLVGHLVSRGQLNVDAPLYAFYNEMNQPLDEDKQSVTIEHALNFNTGINWKEWGVYPSDAMQMWLSDDPYAYILSKSMAYPVGEHFEYQGAMSVLLGGVVEKILGKSLAKAAEEILFEPMGFEGVEWFTHEVTHQHMGSSGLYLRSRDLAKLGQLYLNQGEWNGEFIFSPEWAKASLEPKGKFWPDKAIQYGYNWWFPLMMENGEKIKIAAMRGSGGQEMVILPDHDLIFVMTSGAYIGQDEDFPFELIAKFVLPSLGIEEVKYQR
ncbi:serine hydrolase domain-containing protein [Vibrio sonorensis]|uniref:serine hydrolase domain-containing protein n=1 Tax=Vibrio sonorensis TaxID=1004316 RepID=UPI0008DA234B|nr:serine hydrolase [Vibrio sonorensis]